MQTVRLSFRLLPATLFLLTVGLRAQSAAPEMAGSVNGPDMTAASQEPADSASGPSRLTPTEQALLKRFDKNGDGKLDDEELAEAHETMHQEQVSKQAGNAGKLYARLLQKFDVEKKGSLTPEEQQQAVAFIQANAKGVYEKLLTRFDKNGDGTLDAQETQAMFDILAQAPKFAEASKELSQPAVRPQNAQARGMIARRVYDHLLTTFDKNHTGSLTPAEQSEALAYLRTNNPFIYQKMVARFDKNHDGVLEPDESQALFDGLSRLPEAPGGLSATADVK